MTKTVCLYCGHRHGYRSMRGLCMTCWRTLREIGTLDTLYPPRRPARGTSPLEWHGRQS
jgi:hypothetical protein